MSFFMIRHFKVLQAALTMPANYTEEYSWYNHACLKQALRIIDSEFCKRPLDQLKRKSDSDLAEHILKYFDYEEDFFDEPNRPPAPVKQILQLIESCKKGHLKT